MGESRQESQGTMRRKAGHSGSLHGFLYQVFTVDFFPISHVCFKKKTNKPSVQLWQAESWSACPPHQHLIIFTNNTKMFTQTKISKPACLLFHNRQALFQKWFHYTKKKKSGQKEGWLFSKFRFFWAGTEKLNRWYSA